MPGFTSASTVKYIVDIELLVLRSILALILCHPRSAMVEDVVHLFLVEDANAPPAQRPLQLLLYFYS